MDIALAPPASANDVDPDDPAPIVHAINRLTPLAKITAIKDDTNYNLIILSRHIYVMEF